MGRGEFLLLATPFSADDSRKTDTEQHKTPRLGRGDGDIAATDANIVEVRALRRAAIQRLTELGIIYVGRGAGTERQGKRRSANRVEVVVDLHEADLISVEETTEGFRGKVQLQRIVVERAIACRDGENVPRSRAT